MLKILLLLIISSIYGSGGYDHGTSAGRGRLDLDITWNPFKIFDYGQNYVVWGYGLSDNIDFHGYYSTGSSQNPQVYYGVMWQFYEKKYLDFSTAIGVRDFLKEDRTNIFSPQLLYTFKPTNGFRIGGSIVNVMNIEKEYDIPITIDTILLYKVWPNVVIPFRYLDIFFQSGIIKSIHFGISLFYTTSNNLYPTYSIDLKF